VQKVGREKLADPGGLARWEASVAQGKGADLAVILYTSGTTGGPKGVMLSYDNMHHLGAQRQLFDKLDENEETIAYLPLAWVGDHLFSYAQHYVAGYLRQLPGGGRDRGGGPTRDRHHLRVRAAARLREPADAHDGAHGGRGALKRRCSTTSSLTRASGARRSSNKEPVPLTARLIYRLGDSWCMAR
jgi:long-chain acyl-CoA synthetase